MRTTTKLEALLHPIRLRIVTALQGRVLTPRQLHARLGDVPPATLYRHINQLLDAGVLAVVEERRVHGTLERRLAIPMLGDMIGPDEVQQMTGEEILALSTLLLGIMGESFQRYAAARPRPPRPREISLLVDTVFMSDDEYSDFRTALLALWQTALTRPEAPGRQRRQLAYFTVPDLSEEAP